MNWLFGRGQRQKVKASDVSWKPISKGRAELSERVGNNQTVHIGISAQGFNSFEHIGRGTGTFHGNITKTSTGYTAKGTFTPDTDYYDFNSDLSRGIAEVPTLMGAASGAFIQGMSFGTITPVDYYIEFEGSVEVEWSW